ncbi:hypothetical protein FHS96_005461 [Sphingomonas zeicaulis]|uniref:hypothetical protein n=1 Tax=Sphingomonas zeicaulis TaxID=1632740 RepID=UPI003D1ECDA1
MRKTATLFTHGLAATALIATAMLPAAPALAQGGAPDQNTGQRAKGIATQPLEDLNIHKDKIPPKLVAIQDNPYNLSGMRTCKQLNAEIIELNGVLGADVDATQEARQKTEDRIVSVGGSLVGSLIPFRGLVREVTGANAQQRRFEAAIYAGTTRRSYLKGTAKAKGCKPLPPVTAAEVDAGVKKAKEKEEAQKAADKQ